MPVVKVEKPIYPVHPVFAGKNVTVGDVVEWSYLMDISPNVLIEIIRGRMRPHEVMIERMERVWSDTIINEIVNNYDPFRDLEFRQSPPRSDEDYTYHRYYPAILLGKGDMVRCDNDTWLVLSGVKRVSASTVRLFSDGFEVADISIYDEVIAYSRDPESEEYKQNRSEVREVFGAVEASPERLETAMSIMERLKEISEQ